MRSASIISDSEVVYALGEQGGQVKLVMASADFKDPGVLVVLKKSKDTKRWVEIAKAIEVSIFSNIGDTYARHLISFTC